VLQFAERRVGKKSPNSDELNKNGSADFWNCQAGSPRTIRFGECFCSPEAEEFERTFLQWVSSAVKLSKGAVVNIDGKELRGTHSTASKEGLRLVESVGGGAVSCLGAS
jgi:hypothetical protein